MGDRTLTLEMTWIRNMSARRGRQSDRNERKMRFSPFWLKIRMPESIIAVVGRERGWEWELVIEMLRSLLVFTGGAARVFQWSYQVPMSRSEVVGRG